jgi:hypothetical protein
MGALARHASRVMVAERRRSKREQLIGGGFEAAGGTSIVGKFGQEESRDVFLT